MTRQFFAKSEVNEPVTYQILCSYTDRQAATKTRDKNNPFNGVTYADFGVELTLLGLLYIVA